MLEEKFATKRYFEDKQTKTDYACLSCNEVYREGYYTQKILNAPPILAFRMNRRDDQVIEIAEKLDMDPLV